MKENGQSFLEKYIGEKVRSKRIKSGLTLSELAKYLGLSLQQVQKYEQGNSRIPAVLLYKIAKFLLVDISYFYSGIEAFNKKEKENPKTIPKEDLKEINICLIDDDSADTLMIKEIIENTEIETKITNFYDAEKALEFLKNNYLRAIFPKPDIIILDLNVPKKNGHQILKDIKRDPDIKNIPIIILTNSINFNDLMKCYQNYASGYICKSFDLETFEEKLEQMLIYWGRTVSLPRIKNAS